MIIIKKLVDIQKGIYVILFLMYSSLLIVLFNVENNEIRSSILKEYIIIALIYHAVYWYLGLHPSSFMAEQGFRVMRFVYPIMGGIGVVVFMIVAMTGILRTSSINNSFELCHTILGPAMIGSAFFSGSLKSLQRSHKRMQEISMKQQKGY